MELAGTRPFEALLSETALGPCTSGPGTAHCSEATLPDADLSAAAGLLFNEAQASAATQALHELGLVDLLYAQSAGDVRRTLTTLSPLALRSDVDASQLNDIGVATLVDAVNRDSARGLLESVELFDRALEMDSTLFQARFNLGVALERLTFLHSAVDVWLGLEAAADLPNQLAAEVASRRSDTQDRLVRRLSFEAGGTWDAQLDSLIVEWADAVEGDDSGALSATLAGLRELADDFDGRDGYLPLAVAEISSMEPEDRVAFAGPMRALARAGDLHRVRDYEGSVADLERALTLPSTGALWARAKVLRLSVDIVRGDYAEAIPGLLRLAQPRFYGALRGRTHWVLGTALVRAGEGDDATRHYKLAEADFDRVGDRASAARMSLSLLSPLYLAGDSEQVDQILLSVLRRTDEAPSVVALHNTVGSASDYGELWGLPRSATWAALEDRALLLAFDEVPLLAESLTNLGAILVSRGEAAAWANLNEGRQYLGAVRDPSVRALSAAYFDLLTGEALMSQPEGFTRAGVHFDSAIEYYERFPQPGLNMRALVGRAAVAQQAGDHDVEVAFLSRALEYARVSYSGFSSPAERATLSASLAQAVNRLSADAYERSPLEALAIQEDARALVSTGGSVSPDDALAWMGTQPAGSALLAYSSLDDETLAWVVRDGALTTSSRIDLGADELNELAHASADPRPSVSDEAMRRLSSLLLDPIRSALNGTELIAVVPDGALRGVPFGALLDPATGERLFQAQPVVSVASGRHFVEATLAARSRDVGPDEHRGLFVAGVEVDALPRLPGALREVDELTAIYPPGASQGEGNLESLRDDLAGATIVHFAGHTTFDPLNPALSRLALKRADDDESFARVRELVEAGGEELRLVVLSACSTDRVDRTQAAAPWNVGQEALAMGVPGVLVSLWPVDDDTTRAFMLEFHRALLTGVTPAEALQAAQRTMSQSDDPRLARVQSWAGFRLIGV